MFGLTQSGGVHTAISLVAVAPGIVALVRYKEIAVSTRTCKFYVATTALTCVTGFGIFQHGGFGAPHALGILTLLMLAVAIAAEIRRSFGSLSRYIAVIGYTTTFFFHMIPAFTETSTGLPFGHPLANG